MKFFKTNPNATAPVYATERAAAFDLCAALEGTDKVRAYNGHNREMMWPVKLSAGRPSTQIPPGFRVLVPTGIAFDIPEGYTLDLNIRSGVALKLGLELANGTGVIDEDYNKEVFAILANPGDTPITIYDGERIVQGKIVPVTQVALEETSEAIPQKGNRVGGFGSTGVEAKVAVTEKVAVATEAAPVEEKPKRKAGRPKKVKTEE